MVHTQFNPMFKGKLCQNVAYLTLRNVFFYNYIPSSAWHSDHDLCVLNKRL